MPERDDPRADIVRPAARGDPEYEGSDLHCCEHRRRLALPEPALVVQVEDDEAEHRHLRDHVKATDDAEAPQAPVAQRPLDVLDLEVDGRGLAEHDRPDEGSGEAESAEKHVRAVDAHKRENERADETAHRYCRLSDPEREPAFRLGEPPHHRAARRGVDARARGTREEEQDVELREALRPSRRDEEDAAPAEAHREHDPLADPVREESPRKERDERPEPVGRENGADLRERETEGVANRRGDRGQANADRREAGLRKRAGGQDGPAVRRAADGARARRG